MATTHTRLEAKPVFVLLHKDISRTPASYLSVQKEPPTREEKFSGQSAENQSLGHAKDLLAPGDMWQMVSTTSHVPDSAPPTPLTAKKEGYKVEEALEASGWVEVGTIYLFLT